MRRNQVCSDSIADTGDSSLGESTILLGGLYPNSWLTYYGSYCLQLKPNIEKTPMGRLAQPQEVADSITFLASERASYITGSSLVVSY
jgi:NAD(P)-dependent dehydrogenase (short-subunit alcohol dehydrogenase family)